MGKTRVSLYIRYGAIVVSGTSTSPHPDALDDVRATVSRAFCDALRQVSAPSDPGTVPTTDLPPLD